MEPLAESPSTPGLDAAARLVASFAEHPQRAARYPDGTAFIAADLPDAAAMIDEAEREKRPVALVFPDGSDVVARPPRRPTVFFDVAVFLLALRDRRGRGTEDMDRPLYLPRGWTTEVHSAGEPVPG